MSESILPTTWIKTCLGDISLKITDGSHNPPPRQTYGLPMLSAQNILNNQIVFEGYRLIEKSAFEEEYKRANVEINDVLLTIVGTIGRSSIVPGNLPKFTLQRSVALIKPAIINPKWLTYYLQSNICQNFFSISEKGTAQKGVYLSSLKIIPVHLSPLQEQHRIVAKIEELFSELDKGIETLKTAQQQLKSYRQAVLKYAFEGKLTGKWRELNEDLCDRVALEAKINEARDAFYKQQITDWEDSIRSWEELKYSEKKPSRPSKLVFPDPPSVDHLDRKWEVPADWLWTQIGSICFVTKLAGFEYTEYVKYDSTGDLSVLKAENAGVNGFKKTEYSKVHSSSVKMLKRSILNGGELLLAFVGSVGNVATVPGDQKYFLGPNIGMARPYLKINPKFLEYQLQSALGRNMLLASMKAVTQPSLSMGTIRQTPIVLTSLDEQVQLVLEIESRLSVCDKIEESIEQGLQQAEALRQSILKKAFEGKLVPQDPNDEPASVLLERIKSERAAALPQKKTRTKKIKG